MRRLIYSVSVSLDGFIETPDRSLEWVQVDEELHRSFNDQARKTGTWLYGRRMYELMAESWPHADEVAGGPDYIAEFAGIWRTMPKIVFSKTLERVEWNARLVRSDAGEEVRRLKAEDGADLSVSGAELAGAFIGQGLVDEYQLFVNPVILGAGTRMLPELGRQIDLKLVHTREFGSGVVLLEFRPGKQA